MKELKPKNKKLLFSLFIIFILLSSCNQEEGKFVLSQYNFSNMQKYEIINEKSLVESKDVIISSSAFNQPILVSSNKSLSYGASFTKDSVKINQIKISNNQFNWTFSPVSFEDKNTQYFGAKNLIVPNDKMLGDSFNCDIFLEDGTIINDEIINKYISIPPLKQKLSVLDDMLLIINPINNGKDSVSENVDSNNIDKIDLLKIKDLDILADEVDANYVLKFYKDNKLMLGRELNIDLNKEYCIFKSSYLKKCDTIFLATKVSNNALSCNLYTMK